MYCGFGIHFFCFITFACAQGLTARSKGNEEYKQRARIFLLDIGNQVCCVSHRAAAELLQYLLLFIGHIKPYVFSDLHVFCYFLLD